MKNKQNCAAIQQLNLISTTRWQRVLDGNGHKAWGTNKKSQFMPALSHGMNL